MKKIALALLIVLGSSLSQAQQNVSTENGPYAPERPANTERNLDAIPPLSFTPSVQIINFPHPLDVSGELVFYKLIGLKYSKSVEPRYTSGGDTVKIDDQSVALRVYPLRGQWFLGLGLGQHEGWAHRNTNIQGFDTDIDVHVKSQYLTPTTGWKIVYQSGLTLGFEVGWIFPTNPSGEVSTSQDNNPLVTSNPDYQKSKSDANDTVHKFISTGVPDIGLLEIGWTF